METEVERTEAIIAHCPRAELIEHVMRRSRNDIDVVVFTEVEPLSDQYMRALGRLLVDSPGPLHAGTPLAVWAGGGVLTPQWRETETTVTSSVWGEFEMLRSLVGAGYQHNKDACPFEALTFLRSIL
jgi:hypothetical protein